MAWKLFIVSWIYLFFVLPYSSFQHWHDVGKIFLGQQFFRFLKFFAFNLQRGSGKPKATHARENVIVNGFFWGIPDHRLPEGGKLRASGRGWDDIDHTKMDKILCPASVPGAPPGKDMDKDWPFLQSWLVNSRPIFFKNKISLHSGQVRNKLNSFNKLNRQSKKN